MNKARGVRTVMMTGQRGTRQERIRTALVAGALAMTTALAGCEREVILEGERFSVREPLDNSLPVEGAPAPVSAPARPENQSVPISLGGGSANADWTHRAGNARHQMPHGALSAQPARVWTASIGTGNSRRNRIAAAPVVADGRIFAMDAATVVSATSTGGATLWQADLTAAFDRGGEVSGGGLAYGGGRLFATTGYGELVAIDPASGSVVWRQRVDSVIGGAPTFADGTVYVGARDGSAWAISAADGKVIWQVIGTPGFVGYLGSAAPTVMDGAVLFPSASGELRAISRDGSGVENWRASVAGKRRGRAFASSPDITADPLVVGDTLFTGTAAGRTVALSATTGQRVWEADEGALGPIAAGGGSLFLVNDEGRLVRLDAATGATVWSQELSYYLKEKPAKREAIVGHYGPVLAGGRVVVASSDGLLRSFDPADGSLVATAEIPGGAAAQPAMAGGVLYVVGAKGQLHAFR